MPGQSAGLSSGVLWVRRDDGDRVDAISDSHLGGEAVAATTAKPPSAAGDGAGGVLWVRQDPWESLRQPAVPSQTRASPAISQLDGADGEGLPFQRVFDGHSSDNDSGVKAGVWQGAPAGKGRVQVAATVRQLSHSGNGHRAAVFDNVE